MALRKREQQTTVSFHEFITPPFGTLKIGIRAEHESLGFDGVLIGELTMHLDVVLYPVQKAFFHSWVRHFASCSFLAFRALFYPALDVLFRNVHHFRHLATTPESAELDRAFFGVSVTNKIPTSILSRDWPQ